MPRAFMLCGMHFVAGCVLFFSCLAACAGQETAAAVDLAAGHPVSVLLTPGQDATLRVVLSGTQAEEIVFDAAVPDIAYRIASSDGTEILSGHLATFGWAAIPVIIPSVLAAEHEVRIQLKSEGGAEGLPAVRVRAELFPAPRRSLPLRIRAAKAFNAAQPLHRSLRAEDIELAIGHFEQAAADWARAGDTYGEALAWGGKGESEIELSRYGDARRTLDTALGLAGNNAYVRGWLLHLAARVLFDEHQGKPARDYAEEELRLGQELSDPALIALARTDLAGVAFWLRDSKMGEIADQAHSEAIGAGVPETVALERRWKAWVEEYYERIVRGMSLLSESEVYFRRAGDRRNALDAVLQVNEAVSLNGDFYSALAMFSKLDPVVRASGNAMKYGVNLINIGNQYQGLNNPRLAKMYYRRAETASAGAHILFGHMLSHEYLCETELQLNETAKAVSECKLSLSLARQFDDPAYIGQALCDLGLAERKAGSFTQAFADLTAAARVTHTIHDLRFESKEHIQLGELLEQQGRRPEALAEFEQAKSLSQGVADPASLLEAQYAVARWYTREGQFAKADAELAPALEKLEATRQSVSSSTLQASYFAAGRKCYDLAVELRMRQFERDPAGGGDTLALEVSERGRARGLLDALSARSNSGARESGEAEAHLMRAKLNVDRAFNHRLKLLLEGGVKRNLEASSADLTQAVGDLERTEDEVYAATSRGMKPAPTMSTAEIERASASSGITFFEYALGQERGYLWVIGGGKVKSYVLPSRERIENLVRQWRALTAGQERSEADSWAKLQSLSTRLSCALFADAVQPGMTRMVIVPDGELAMLAFALLPEKGCSSAPGEPLVVGHEITMSPSLSVFLCRKPEVANDSFQGEVAIVADPVFDASDPRAAALKRAPVKHDLDPPRDPDTAAAIPRLLNAGYEASAIREDCAEGGRQTSRVSGARIRRHCRYRAEPRHAGLPHLAPGDAWRLRRDHAGVFRTCLLADWAGWRAAIRLSEGSRYRTLKRTRGTGGTERVRLGCGQESEWGRRDGAELLVFACRRQTGGFHVVEHRRRKIERIDDRILHRVDAERRQCRRGVAGKSVDCYAPAPPLVPVLLGWVPADFSGEVRHPCDSVETQHLTLVYPKQEHRV